MKTNLLILTMIVLTITACSNNVIEDTNDQENTSSQEQSTSTEYYANLTNVSTEPSWEGEVFLQDKDGKKSLYANFYMDQPEENYFYEGWLVCDGVPHSTGATTPFEGLEENIFSGYFEENCEKYVLTLEPDDQDPAPAEHLFEGEFIEVAEEDKLGESFWSSEEFEPIVEITHDELISSQQLACDNELEFSFESLSNGSYTLTLTKGTSGFLPTDGNPIELEEVVSGSGVRYESFENNLIVLEQAGTFTIESDNRVAAENCVAI